MNPAANTRLVIADDHPLFRDALRQAVASVLISAKIDEAGSFEDLTALLEQDSDVDLILLDLTMPGISGFSGLIYLRAQYPAIPVVIVSASDDVGTIRRSLDFGASGFIPKRFGVETLRDAIAKVMDGDVWVPPDTDLSSAADPEMARLRDRLVTLTPQQVRVLMMLSQGLLNKQIAYELGVSEATIKAHVSAILQKLGVESRTQAVITRRSLDVKTADEFGKLDQSAIDLVKEQTWPDPENADELHDALLIMGVIPTAECGLRNAEWKGEFENLLAAGRAAVLDGRLWVAAERIPMVQAVFPGAPIEPPVVAPERERAKAWTREDAIRELKAVESRLGETWIRTVIPAGSFHEGGR